MPTCVSVSLENEKKYKLENEKMNGKLDFNVPLIPNFRNLRIQSFINNVCVRVRLRVETQRVEGREKVDFEMRKFIFIYSHLGLTQGVCLSVFSIIDIPQLG